MSGCFFSSFAPAANVGDDSAGSGVCRGVGRGEGEGVEDKDDEQDEGSVEEQDRYSRGDLVREEGG